MHTTNASRTIFHHNSDFSGDVKIVCGETFDEVTVPFEDIKQLVAEWVRREKIAQLESMDADELLTPPPDKPAP